MSIVHGTSATAAALHRGIAAAAIAIAILFGPSSAMAQRVALARPTEGDPLLVEAFNRLGAELRLQDFQIAILDPADLRASDTIGVLAKRASAVAGVVVFRHDGRLAVDVWLDDGTADRMVVHRLEPAAGSELPNVVAIRTVDLLKASLREQSSRHPIDTPRVDREPLPDVARAPEALPDRPWEVRAEGVAIYDGATLGMAVGAALGLARRISGPLRVGVLISGPLAGARWETSEGTALVRQQVGWIELRLAWFQSSRIDLGASAAIGAHHLTAVGNAKRPLLSQTDQVWSLAGTLGVDGSFRFTSNTGATIGMRAMGLSPRPGVGVGTSATVLQLPLLSASVGLLVAF